MAHTFDVAGPAGSEFVEARPPIGCYAAFKLGDQRGYDLVREESWYDYVPLLVEGDKLLRCGTPTGSDRIKPVNGDVQAHPRSMSDGTFGSGFDLCVGDWDKLAGMAEATGKQIRVIYRWRLGPEHREAFRDWWHEGTLRIRASYEGALGSTLMFPIDDESQIVAVARWRSRADLERFWASPGGTPFGYAVMESAEVLDEVDDLTIQP